MTVGKRSFPFETVRFQGTFVHFRGGSSVKNLNHLTSLSPSKERKQNLAHCQVRTNSISVY